MVTNKKKKSIIRMAYDKFYTFMPERADGKFVGEIKDCKRNLSVIK